MKQNNPFARQAPGQQQFQTQPQTQKNAPERNSGASFQFSFQESDAEDRELRKPRSRAYMEIFDAIDLVSATDEEIIARLQVHADPDLLEEFSEMSTEELLEEIRASIQEEFRNLSIEIEQVLHGVLAKCYIDGCDCHSIAPNGWFMDHYQIGGPIPENLAKGRALFGKFPDCRCIEVYSNCCRVIQQDSSVVKVMNKDI